MMAIDKEKLHVLSRLARKPIIIPAGVSVGIDKDVITVKGPNGTLTKKIHPYVTVTSEDGNITIQPDLDTLRRPAESKRYRAMTGTFYALIRNMVQGVTSGFQKELQIVGVGYKAALKGKTLNLDLGYAHDVNVEPPEGITFVVPAPNKIVVKGADKERVGQVAANIRKWREPMVYGGKGIRYSDEVVILKVGKKV
jgi:large subunit ribosomal protein L6